VGAKETWEKIRGQVSVHVLNPWKAQSKKIWSGVKGALKRVKKESKQEKTKMGETSMKRKKGSGIGWLREVQKEKKGRKKT